MANQAFEDLKQDIQGLIDTASDTIRQIVDDAAARVKSAGSGSGSVSGVPATSGVGSMPMPSGDGSEFTSQIEELRTKIRVATDNLKAQAKEALSNAQNSSGNSSSGSSGSVPGVGSGSVGTDTSATPSAGPGLNEGSVQSNNTDDQMPAGGSAQSPNTSPGTPVPPAPEFGSDAPAAPVSTIGPDSFKSGA